MASAPVIYLDSQDYSRFGDVLRGKSDSKTEALFLALEQRKQSGDAIFAVSMPLLGELLQYHEDYRETTIRKAEAVERLCGGWALAFPSRLIAAEVASAARRFELLPQQNETTVLTSDWYWYPNVADSFRNLRAQIQEGLDKEMATRALPTRTMRRQAKKALQKIDFAAVARESASQMAEKLGLPIDAITGSIVSLLRGKVTPEEASRKLFGAIAEPVKFVEMYFEVIEGDRSLLPAWMKDFGIRFETLFRELRDNVQSLLKVDIGRNSFDAALAERTLSFGEAILKLAEGDTAELGIDKELFARLRRNSQITSQIPACDIVGNVLTCYIRQILGFAGTEAKIEDSFGGDLVHALYLPHVDLWRGDRRFSEVIKNAVPSYANKVVSKLNSLAAAIDAHLTA